MTIRAISGLVVLNALYLVVGTSALWAFRGWRSWTEYLRFAGLAYVLGVAVVGIVWTLLLVLDVPFGVATIVLTCLTAGVAALLAGRQLGRRRPSRGSVQALTALSLVSAAGIALTAVFLEALFRAGRLYGLVAFDAWAFWVPKAKAIYEFGRLDEQFFLSLPGPTYPPVVPILDAAAFHAMGSADVVTLRLQYWFFAFGFVAALAGLLWKRVPGWILWPLLLLALVAPRTSVHFLTPQADFLLQLFFCAAAVLAALWLVDGPAWHLVSVTALLAAAVLTKREGVLLAVFLLVALVVATVDRRRFAWPRIALSAAIVAAIGLSWRLWYLDRGVRGEAPIDLSGGVERARGSARLASDVFLDPSLWSILTYLAFAAVVLAAIWGSLRLAVLFGLLFLLIPLGGAGFTFVFHDLSLTANEALNPIVRYSASAALLAGVAVPLLLASVWERQAAAREAPR